MQEHTVSSIDMVPEPWADSPDPLTRKHFLADLGEEIAELSAHIEAATWRLLRAISDFDRMEGWNLGFMNCAHWLTWRCGWDNVTAREKVRVARALDNLPKISDALRTGRVSYSKVRAMTRVANPANEEELLNIALSGTASHVESVVRGYRRATEGQSLEDVQRRQEDRALQIYTDGDGMVIIRARLTPEVGAVVKKALEAAMEQIRAEDRKSDAAAEEQTEDQESTDEGASAETSDVSAQAPGNEPAENVPRINGKYFSGLPLTGAIYDETSDDWVMVEKPEEEVPYPPVIARYIAKKKQTAPTDDSAETSPDQDLNDSAETHIGSDNEASSGSVTRSIYSSSDGIDVDDSAETIEKPTDSTVSLCLSPALEGRVDVAADDSAETSGEDYSDPPSSINSAGDGNNVLNFMRDRSRDSMDQLYADALGLVAEAALGQGLGSRERGEPFQVVLHVDREVLAGSSQDGRCDLENGPGVSAETGRRIACDAPVLPVKHGPTGSDLEIGRKTRRISSRLWRFLLERDKHCRFPGCNRTGRLQAHHIQHWAQGGETSPSNLLTLCRGHHWTVHEGGYRVRGDAAGEAIFVRPDGSELHEVPPIPVVPRDPMDALMARNREHDLEIEPETNLVDWGGEGLDLVAAVDGILHAEEGCESE